LEGFTGNTFFSGANIASIFALTYALLQIPYGNMIDKIGLRRTMIGLSFLMGTGFFLCCLSHSLISFAIGRWITALGCAGAFISMVKVTEVEFGSAAIAKIVGALVAFALLLGLLFLKFASPFMVGDNIWRIMYGIKGILAISIFICFQFFIKNKTVQTTEEKTQAISFMEFVGIIRKNFYILSLLLFCLIFFMIFYGTNETPFIAVIYEKLGITKNNTYSVLLFGFLAGFLTLPSVAKIIGEIKTCFIMSLTLMGLSVGMLCYPNKILAYLFALIAGYSNGLQMTVVEMTTADLPDSVTGKSSGLMNVLFVGGVFLAQQILFYLVPRVHTGENTLFIFTAICALCSALIMVLIAALKAKRV
jgi:MFS family permease